MERQFNTYPVTLGLQEDPWDGATVQHLPRYSWPTEGPLGWSNNSTPTPLLGSAVQPSSAWEALESRRMTKERGERMSESHTVR